MEFNTALLHQQFDSDTQNGATIPPIYQVSAFAQSSAEQLEKCLIIKQPDLHIPESAIRP